MQWAGCGEDGRDSNNSAEGDISSAGDMKSLIVGRVVYRSRLNPYKI